MKNRRMKINDSFARNQWRKKREVWLNIKVKMDDKNKQA